jgi:hypothetical protein
MSPFGFAKLARLAARRGPAFRIRRASAQAQRVSEAECEARRIIAAAEAEGDAIVAGALASLASLQAAVAAAQETLTGINGHISEATRAYKRLEAETLRRTHRRASDAEAPPPDSPCSPEWRRRDTTKTD